MWGWPACSNLSAPLPSIYMAWRSPWDEGSSQENANIIHLSGVQVLIYFCDSVHAVGHSGVRHLRALTRQDLRRGLAYELG